MYVTFICGLPLAIIGIIGIVLIAYFTKSYKGGGVVLVSIAIFVMLLLSGMYESWAFFSFLFPIFVMPFLISGIILIAHGTKSYKFGGIILLGIAILYIILYIFYSLFSPYHSDFFLIYFSLFVLPFLIPGLILIAKKTTKKEVERENRETIKNHDKFSKYENDDEDADKWYFRGFAFEQSGKYEEAIECYDKALEISPDDSLIKEGRDSVLKKLREQKTLPIKKDEQRQPQIKEVQEKTDRVKEEKIKQTQPKPIEKQSPQIPSFKLPYYNKLQEWKSYGLDVRDLEKLLNEDYDKFLTEFEKFKKEMEG